MAERATGRTALVSGANSGVGLELTKRLLSEDWDVIALIRSDFPAGEPQIAPAQAEGRLRVYRADLSDFKSLRGALEEIKASEAKLDVLFNNAAAALPGIRHSPQGREMHFEVNTVVPYIIAMELKPLLAKGDLKTIVNTSSNAMLYVRQFDLDLLEHPKQFKPITGPYAASKLGLSLWTQELAPALQAEGFEIRSVNPGANKTKMSGGEAMPKWLGLLQPFFPHPSAGAARVYDVAVGPWRGKSGVFVHSGKATPFKFTQQGPQVLKRVAAIYQREFLSN
jgi:NAD(P)-dependent dehydrogenase (short-subunit alcohol dehydrogenase family)